MIYGDTSGNTKFGPNFNTDRVVSFSKGTPAPVKTGLKKASKMKANATAKAGRMDHARVILSAPPVVSPVKKKPKGKTAKQLLLERNNAKETFTPQEEAETSQYLNEILKSDIAPAPSKSRVATIRERLRKTKPVEHVQTLAEMMPDAVKSVAPAKKKKRKKVKAENHNEQLASLDSSASATSTTTKKSGKTNAKPKSKDTADVSKPRLIRLREEDDLTPEQQEEAELELLKSQLKAKLAAAAAEEGVEMTFDVDAAMAEYKTMPSSEALAPTPSKASAKKLNSRSKLKQKPKGKKLRYKDVLKKERAIDYVEDESPLNADGTIKKPRPKIVLPDGEQYISITPPKPPSASKKKRDRIIAENKLGSQYVAVVPENLDKLDARQLASNAVDIPEHEVAQFRKRTTSLTRTYIDFLRKDVLPHMMALDSAVDYTRALMVDGLAREDVATDDSLLITMRWILHKKAMEFFSKEVGASISSEHFNQVVAELFKSDLIKSTTYTSDTVGVVRKGKFKEKSNESSLGVVASKDKRKRDGKETKA